MARLVVAGHGMVAARFLQELSALGNDHDVEVFAAEDCEPYNRVLLTDLLMGTAGGRDLRLPGIEDPRIRVRRGTSVASLDRHNRRVRTSDGTTVGYDHLVLATGARARTVDLEGIDSHQPPTGVHVLRSIDDAAAIIAAASQARSAVVLGGGVLGLEVACGLARRTASVTVVHPTGVLMDRQLNAGACEALQTTLAAMGISCLLHTTAEKVLTRNGNLSGLVLSDGRRLDAELLVMSCGTVPETGVAQAAGLTCAPGVLIDADTLATEDPLIYAIGDCASPPEGSSGLVAQGWEQARRLARLLTGSPVAAPSRTPAPTDVVRVKGGLDVVSMGVNAAASTHSSQRRIQLLDASAGRFVEVVVDGDRIVGATAVGAGSTAADLTAAYTRAIAVPKDPAQMLIRPSDSAAARTGSPTTMPESLTVCSCNGVSKGDLMRAWGAGDRSVAEVSARTRATTGCGGCSDVVAGIVEWLAAGDPDQTTSSGAPEDDTQRKRDAHEMEMSRG